MKIYEAAKSTPMNKRNNCLCDSGVPCYYHLEKGAWFDKYTNEQINPTVWSYAILPVTMTATLENFLMTLIQFGENTAKQDFAQLSPERQAEAFDELVYTRQTIEKAVKD